VKTYIDCGSGVAGDMLLGALIGLGLSPKELERTLKRVIPVKGWRLAVRPVERKMWPAWTLRVEGDRPFGPVEKMMGLLKKSTLPAPVKGRSLRIFQTLRWAEAKAHGKKGSDFDPKGLGRIDTLVDVIGSAWGFWKLGLHKVQATRLNTGRIAPATAQILKRYRIPIFSDETQYELATPTGTAILSDITSKFVSRLSIRLTDVGYGAGTLERPRKPNVLAIYRGKLL
jgi:uncharacterized protein (DUF111 family)